MSVTCAPRARMAVNARWPGDLANEGAVSWARCQSPRAPSMVRSRAVTRSFLLQAKVNPDTDMKRIAFSGAHDATVAAVAGGKVDAGALNISVWDKLGAQNKVDPKQVRVFYTTPGYYDYNWTVRADMNPELRKKLNDAFLALDRKDPQGREILELQRATRFIPTKVENYAAIEAAARNAGLLK